MSTAQQLLLVEDDQAIGQSLTEALTGQGYEITWARTAREAQAHVTGARAVELVLLDLGLPDLDGLALCRELRATLPSAVIVILTARHEEIDIVVGLEAGADDYLIKPFRFTELLARLRAHLRRETQRADSPTSAAPAGPQTIGQVMLDRAARRCTIGGQPIDLRPKEFDLLDALLSHAGEAVSRERLMARAWDEHWFGSTKTLDMHIAMLRRRLADHGENPARISTLRGYGYRYEIDPPA